MRRKTEVGLAVDVKKLTSAFHPKALNLSEKGRSPGLPAFAAFPYAVAHSGYGEAKALNRGSVQLTVAGTAPDFNRIPF